jgi:ribonuclease T1
MHKSVKLWLSAAVIFAFSFNPFFVFAEGNGCKVPAGAVSLGALRAADFRSAIAAFPELENINAPAAAPEIAAEPGRAAAPAPGKDLLPVVRDDMRVKAILKLISDVYYGRPLPYAQDGSVFTNKEGLLPVQPRGFYREYTLLTGGAPHTVTIGETTYQVAPDLSARGSERVIIGGGEKVYYTPDHYAHFILLAVVY